MYQDTPKIAQCQPGIRIGRVILSERPGRPGGGCALLPIERQEAGGWLLSGVLRVDVDELGYRCLPRGRCGRRKLVRKAVRVGYRVLREAI